MTRTMKEGWSRAGARGDSLRPGCHGYHTIGDGTGGCVKGRERERERTTGAGGGGWEGGLQSRLTGHTAASFPQSDRDRQIDRDRQELLDRPKTTGGHGCNWPLLIV